MKKGFTIIELLVAGILMSMLMMILTMIFNQSSVAWRTANADNSQMNSLRSTITEIRVAADDAYVWDGKGMAIANVWDGTGKLQKRAIDVTGSVGSGSAKKTVKQVLVGCPFADNMKPTDIVPIPIGDAGNSGSAKTFVINVKCGGPDRKIGTYDDIWSFPDDFD